MNICLLTASRSFEVIVGGEERFTISLGKWLLNRGHNVIFVSRKLFGVDVVEGSSALPANSNVKMETFQRLQLPYPIFILTMLLTSLLFVLHILSLNRRQKITIIHAQDTGYGGLSAVISGKLLRIPVILSSHGIRYFTISNALKGTSAALCLPWEYWLDLFTCRLAKVVINVSSVGDRFFAATIEKDKLRTIPIGIETNYFKVNEEVRQVMRKQLGIKDNVLLGFVGRLAPEKNLFTLFEAFSGALNHANGMKLVLIGTGPIESKLRTFSHNRGLSDKIIFAGIRSDVNQFLSAVDIFILPSYTEGCPTSLLEAMASGKAIIASNIPSIREMVSDSKEAILVNPHNANKLKQAILLLYNDPDKRAQLGRKARERAKLYDVNIVYDQILNVYENLSTPLKTVST